MAGRTTPRAKLFAREQSKVKDLEGFMRMMRLNKYQADPLSEGDPTNTIAARYDLEPTSVSPVHNWTCRAHGAVDAKVVGAASFAAGAVYAINGPTGDVHALVAGHFCIQCTTETYKGRGDKQSLVGIGFASTILHMASLHIFFKACYGCSPITDRHWWRKISILFTLHCLLF